MVLRADGQPIEEVFGELDGALLDAYEADDPYTIDLEGVMPSIRVDSMDPLQVYEYPLWRRIPKFAGEMAVERLVWVRRKPFNRPNPYLVVPVEVGEAQETEIVRYGHGLASYDSNIMNEMFEHLGLPYRFHGFINQDDLYKNTVAEERPHLRIVR